MSPLSYIDPRPFAPVGNSAGCALGAKLCYPEREVWCVVGDGSCGYTMMDIDTFTRHKVGFNLILETKVVILLVRSIVRSITIFQIDTRDFCGWKRCYVG